MGKDHELDDKREMDPSPKTSDDLAIIENEKEREREKEVGLIESHVVEGVNDPRPTNDGQVSLYLLLLIASACVGGLMVRRLPLYSCIISCFVRAERPTDLNALLRSDCFQFG